MAKLITNAKDIATAETADLVFTYNELEGKSITKFESRSTAERRTEMAILAAADRAGHRGVKVGDQPRAEDGKAAAEPATTAVETAGATKAKATTKDKEKAPKAVKTPKEPKAPKAIKEKAPRTPKATSSVYKLITATALGAGDTGIRPNSFRGQILASIVATPGINKEDLVAKHGSYTADVVSKFKRLGYITEEYCADHG